MTSLQLKFRAFLVVPRADCCHERYRGVGIFVDGSSKASAMTGNNIIKKTEFDMLEFKTGETLTGKEFKLDWTAGHYAQVQWIEIDYEENKNGELCFAF